VTAAGWLAFLTNLLAAGVARGTPLLLATLGEILAERAGVMNLGLEGLMLLGAVAGFGAAHATGSVTLGLLAGTGAGAALALVHALVTVTLKADQVVSGLALAFVGAGLSSVLGAPLVEVRQAGAQAGALAIPLLSQIPLLGQVFFNQGAVVYLSLLLVPLCWVFLARTRPGLHLKAVGEHPAAADSLGVSVTATRYLYVTLGGALAGMAGASLSVAITPGWVDGMTAGQGWVAVGLVIFARWDPFRAALGAWLFGTLRRLPLDLQGLPAAPWLHDPNLAYFLNMLPYAFTVLVLVAGARKAASGRSMGPAALGRPFTRGER
jgi:simple sugar transport system permease protein